MTSASRPLIKKLVAPPKIVKAPKLGALCVKAPAPPTTAAILSWADEILGGKPLPRDVRTIENVKSILDGLRINLGLLRYRALLEELILEGQTRLDNLRTNEGEENGR